MPGEDKRCPKGERRDKKTKKCVKVGRLKTPSPKKNTVKAHSPKNSSKTTRKSPLLKKITPVKMNIPYVSSMSDLKPYDKRYMKQLLVRLSNILEGKSLDKDGHPYIYAHQHELLDILKKEIHSITTTQRSGDYSFTTKNIKLVIPQLERLMEYFKHIANKKGHIDVDTIAKLYED
jgi:hypothetical protein